MKLLNYKTLEELNYKPYLLKDAPERILQFGEGNFMRAFVDYFVDVMNEKANFNSKIVICQPIENGLSNIINEQEGLYSLFLRGFENGKKVNNKRVISSVSRCINPYKNYNSLLDCAKNPDLRFITCNTTEAGIVYDNSCKIEDKPAKSFPAKLTQFMYERYKYFSGDTSKGFIILSCELIDNNGQELKKCVLKYAKQWNLSEEFISWIEVSNIFCSTLVDRIVTGYPKNEASEICENLGYKDNLLNTAEIFGFWVIEGDKKLNEELPFAKASLPVIITEDHTPYKLRKVKILNGAHTSFVLGAYKAGQDIVRDCMEDDAICGFMNKLIYDEVIPTLDLPLEELESFAHSVTERFKNPFIDHELLAISLNSTSKWKARLMPSLKEYIKRKNEIPNCITMSFAFYIDFFAGHTLNKNSLIGTRGNNEYQIQDDIDILEFYYNHRNDSNSELVKAVCSNDSFWGENLCNIEGFENKVLEYYNYIKENGAYKAFQKMI